APAAASSTGASPVPTASPCAAPPACSPADAEGAPSGLGGQGGGWYAVRRPAAWCRGAAFRIERRGKMTAGDSQPFDIAVVGAGPCGLAGGGAAKGRGLR